jgi:hypothetical protein
MTAAFHHLKQGNSVGAASLLRRTARRLEICPASFGGIAVAPLCAEVSDWIRALETGHSRLPEEFPQIVMARE